MNKTKLKIGFSLTLIGGATLWAFAASWASANNKISVFMESWSYWWASVALLCGAVNFLKSERPRLIFRWSLVCFCSLCFIIAWNQSNKEFLYWKLRFVPSDAWARMESDMQNGTAEVKNENPAFYQKMMFAYNFKSLGVPEDYVGSFRKMNNDGTENRSVERVSFGHKSRIWGVLEASNGRISLPAGFRCLRIANTECLYFYIGVDY